MFNRSQRFPFKKGLPKKKILTPFFIVRFEKSDNPKYAVVVSKSVSKKAVHRNKTKRVFLQTLKIFLKKQPNKNSLVFFLKRPYTDYSKSVIISELQNLFKKLETNN